MLPKIIEQPDILPGTRTFSWSPYVGQALEGALTLFSLRTLLRSRQHRMILSFYLGIGLAIVVGYSQTGFAGLVPVKGGISTTSTRQHFNDDSHGSGHPCRGLYPDLSSRKLDLPGYGSAASSPLPEGGSLCMARIGGSPYRAHPCWSLPGFVPLAAYSPAVL
jgi:hypothetical protein